MIVVNFSTKGYTRGQQRLSTSLGKWPQLMFREYSEIGSPTHAESPYEFKLWAIEKAFEKDDIILWADSSIWLVGDLSKIETIIKEQGFFGEEAGAWVGRWTNVHTRKYFNLTKEEAKQEPPGLLMFSAGLVGLNKNHSVTMEFFRQWKESAKAGCFRGDWADHRHDMTSASIIAQRLKLPYQRGGSHMAYIGDGYSKPENGVVMHLQGI
jgi:hypothetical protein